MCICVCAYLCVRERLCAQISVLVNVYVYVIARKWLRARVCVFLLKCASRMYKSVRFVQVYVVTKIKNMHRVQLTDINHHTFAIL